MQTMSATVEGLRAILESLLKVDGVTAALVVGRDGFVIESATAAGEEVDSDVVGAIAAAQAKAAIITKTRADARAKGLSAEDEKEAVDDPDDFKRVPDTDFTEMKLAAFHHRVPALEARGAVTGVAGLYTVNREDVHPVDELVVEDAGLLEDPPLFRDRIPILGHGPGRVKRTVGLKPAGHQRMGRNRSSS